MDMLEKFSPENHAADRKTPDMQFQDGPLTLKPIPVERIWGTTTLQPWYEGPTLAGPTGEIWLTSTDCLVEKGGGRGQTLAELTAGSPAVLGAADGAGFPLLVKLLFPNEKLSIQVHPNDAQAQAQGMPRGKTECWYVLDAKRGAEVAVGFKEPITTDEVRAAIADGSIESKMRMIPVEIGDMISVEANTVHAIGPGMVVLETQQYSDTTYRLWDYGRPRELHVEAGMAVTRTDTAAGKVAPEEMGDYTRLISTPFFAVDRFELDGSADIALDHTDQLQILVALGDFCAVNFKGDHLVDLPLGHAVILPATGHWYSVHSRGHQQVIRILQPKAS